MTQNELTHFGIPGMKWGIRKQNLTMTTKTGDKISMVEHPSSRLSSFLTKYSKKAANEIDKTAIFDIKDPNGKTVGDITLYKESPDSINIVWITTGSSVRGKGYGTAVMNSAIKIAKNTGAKTVTLEVPGNSPDAKHIYEKLGFKEVNTQNKDTDDVWGGLTNMKLDLNETKHSDLYHSITKINDSISKMFIENLVTEIDEINITNNLNHSKIFSSKGGNKMRSNELTHFGIPGMRWGIRKRSSTDSRSEEHKKSRTLKVTKVSKMTNQELKTYIERMNLERQYATLNPTTVSKGKNFLGGILKEVGKEVIKEAVKETVKTTIDAIRKK